MVSAAHLPLQSLNLRSISSTPSLPHLGKNVAAWSLGMAGKERDGVLGL